MDIAAPFVEDSLEVGGQFRFKKRELAGGGMHETQRLGMQGLSRHQCETITDKLLIF